MRLIDADALKKQIENFNCKDCNHYNFVRCRACQIDDALTYIDDAPTVDKWISVKDKLPEQAGYKCLVAAKFIDGKYVRFTAFTGYGEPGWWTYETVYMEKAPNNKVHHNFTVTHWMPLPEPPEVKQDDHA